ncbi:MAG TPA: CAP domain-containing protein, partial [Acidimicrobiia bacterium]|nr:CAP domain-containing protein [Acidimicrobiia bacterium]
YGLILAFVVSALYSPAPAYADTVSDEAAFVAKVNELRAGKGLAPLQVNANLVAKARLWSAGMAAAGKIWHSTLSDGVTENWKKLGENVGMGGSVDGLHRAFVNSPHHYENLVDPAFGHVGIGIVMNGSTIYVTQVFMQLMTVKLPTITVPTTPVTAPKPATTTTTAKPPAPKPVVAAVKPAPAPTTTSTTAPPPDVDVPAPPVEAAPVEAPRAPSPLLVSVLERLRTFDS